MRRNFPKEAPVVAIGMALSYALAGVQPASAADSPVTFQLTTYLDAREVGGNVTTPLRIIYQFNPGLASGSGPLGASETHSSYGPLEKMIVEVGKECVALSGAGTSIGVFNNAGTSFTEDSYSLDAEGAALARRQLFRKNIEFLRGVVIDEQATMFSDTSLPTSNQFAASADSVQAAVTLKDPKTGATADLRTEVGVFFDLSIYDLPRALSERIEEVRALPVSADLIAKLVAPLDRARALLRGTFTQKNIKQAREALNDHSKVAQTNRNKLGKETADRLINGAASIASSFPACA